MMGSALALGSAFCFSLTGLLVRRAHPSVSPWAGLVVLLVAQGILAAGVLAAGGGMPALNSPGVGLFLLAGALTAAVGNYLMFTCVLKAGPARASATKVAALVLGMALGIVILGERLPPVAWAGTALILAGIWSLVRPDGSDAPAERSAILHGVFAGLGAGTCYALGNLVRKFGAAHLADPFLGSLLETVGGLMLLLLLPRVHRELRGLNLRRIGPYLGAGAASLGGIAAFIAALRYADLSVVNLLAGVEPVITLGLAGLVVPGMRRPRSLAVGVVVVTLGVMLVVWGVR